MKKISIILCIVSGVTLVSMAVFIWYNYFKPIYREGELTNCYVKIDSVEFKTVTYETGSQSSFYRVVLTCKSFLNREASVRELFSVQAYSKGAYIDGGWLGNVGGHGLEDASSSFYTAAANETFQFVQYYAVENTQNQDVEIVVRGPGSPKRIYYIVFVQVTYDAKRDIATWVIVQKDKV